MSTRFAAKLSLLAAVLFVYMDASAATPSTVSETYPSTVSETYAFYKRLHARLLAGESRKQLEDALPKLDRNMVKAARVSQQRWSFSQNYDEMMKAEILERAVLKGLGIPFTVQNGITHVPAGLMHSYGYLFSQLQTKFGLKGKRWIESRIDERLGLPAAQFSPFSRGEFLTELTRALDQLLSGKNRAARVIGTLTERIGWQKPDGRKVTGEVRTTLTTLGALPDRQSQDVNLLVYEVRLPGERWKYVTAFPVEEGFAAMIKAAKAASDAAFVPRYNLYIDPAWKVISHTTVGFQPR